MTPGRHINCAVTIWRNNCMTSVAAAELTILQRCEKYPIEDGGMTRVPTSKALTLVPLCLLAS